MALKLFLVPTLLWAITLIGRRWEQTVAVVRTATAPSHLELPARMLAGTSVAMIVTYSAECQRPALSGLFSSFPLLACVLAAFTHPAAGAGAVIQLLRGLVSGFYALATFCFALSATPESSGVAVSFLGALGCAMAAQIGLLWIRDLGVRRAGFQ